MQIFKDDLHVHSMKCAPQLPGTGNFYRVSRVSPHGGENPLDDFTSCPLRSTETKGGTLPRGESPMHQGMKPSGNRMKRLGDDMSSDIAGLLPEAFPQSFLYSGQEIP